MAIEFLCECGHELYAPDKNVGKRLRCPICQVAVVIPGESQTALAYKTLQNVEPDVEPVALVSEIAAGEISMLRGSPVFMIGRLLIPLFHGKATLQLDGDCIVEESIRPIARHNRRSSLDSVTGGGVSVIGNPILLFLGLLLLPANGIGLLFLIPWLFVRDRVVYVHTDRTTHAVQIDKSHMDFGRAFVERCLAEAVRPSSETRSR